MAPPFQYTIASINFLFRKLGFEILQPLKQTDVFKVAHDHTIYYQSVKVFKNEKTFNKKSHYSVSFPDFLRYRTVKYKASKKGNIMDRRRFRCWLL